MRIRNFFHDKQPQMWCFFSKDDIINDINNNIINDINNIINDINEYNKVFCRKSDGLLVIYEQR